MVLRANNAFAGIGGHLSTYASAASLYEVGFNHFFRGKDGGGAGDQVFYQGHAAPGMYARAFLEGRLSEDQLDHFRRETSPRQGLSLVPAPAAHARLLGVPDGLDGPRPDRGDLPGPLQPLPRRTAASRDTSRLARLGLPRRRRDGRARVARRPPRRRPRGARQPDLRRQLQPAAPRRPGPRQRQDHPGARGDLPRRRLERHQGHLGPRVGRAPRPRRRRRPRREDERDRRRRVPEVLGRRRRLHPGALLRPRPAPPAARRAPHRRRPRRKLRRGGHDYRKVYAAYKAATEYRGAPTVILAKTIKGWTLGPGVEARNITHQAKKLSEAELRIFRDRLELPIPDEKLKDAPYYHPGPDSEEVQYLLERRRALGGSLPEAGRPGRAACRRPRRPSTPSSRPAARPRSRRRWSSPGCSGTCIRDPDLGRRIVPIIPDEARTFGMDPLFKEVGIYAARRPALRAGRLRARPQVPRGEGRPGPRGGDHRGRLDGQLPGRGDVVRDARRADDPVLHLLLDVRLPADRRPGVGLRRRPRPRLPDGRHGRPDDAQRRGPPARGRPQPPPRLDRARPSGRTTRPSPTSWRRSSATASSGCTSTARTSSTTSRSTTRTTPMPPKPEGVDEGIVRGIYRFAAAPDAAEGRAGGPARRLGLDPPAGPRGPADSSPSGSASPPRSTARRRSSCSAATPSRSSAGTGSTRRRRPRVPYVTEVLGRDGGPIVVATDWMKAIPTWSRRWLPAPLRRPRDRRLRPQRHPRGLRAFFEIDAAEHRRGRAGRARARRRGHRRRPRAAAIADLGIDPDKVDPAAV